MKKKNDETHKILIILIELRTILNVFSEGKLKVLINASKFTLINTEIGTHIQFLVNKFD